MRNPQGTCIEASVTLNQMNEKIVIQTLNLTRIHPWVLKMSRNGRDHLDLLSFPRPLPRLQFLILFVKSIEPGDGVSVAVVASLASAVLKYRIFVVP